MDNHFVRKTITLSLLLLLLTSITINADRHYDPDPADPFDSDRAKIILLGRSGHGKSSLGNVLIGLPPDGIPQHLTSLENDVTPKLTSFKTSREPRKGRSIFDVEKIDRFWRGNVAHPIRIIDTSGYDQVKSNFQLKSSIEETLKSVRYVHAFLWVINAEMAQETGQGFITDDEKEILQLVLRTFQPGSLKNFAIAVITERKEEERKSIKQQIMDALMDHSFALKPELPIAFLNPRHDSSNEAEVRRFDEEAEKLYERIHEFQEHPAIEREAAAELHVQYGERAQELTKEAQQVKRVKGDKKAERKLKSLVNQVARQKEKIIRLKQAKKNAKWTDYASWLDTASSHDEL